MLSIEPRTSQAKHSLLSPYVSSKLFLASYPGLLLYYRISYNIFVSNVLNELSNDDPITIWNAVLLLLNNQLEFKELRSFGKNTFEV